MECLYCMLIFTAGFQEEPGGHQFRVRSTSRERHLLADGRHGIPGIEHVRDTVPGEAAKVFVAKPMLVPHLDRIRPSIRQLAEESIEIGDEISALLVVARPEP